MPTSAPSIKSWSFNSLVFWLSTARAIGAIFYSERPLGARRKYQELLAFKPCAHWCCEHQIEWSPASEVEKRLQDDQMRAIVPYGVLSDPALRRRMNLG